MTENTNPSLFDRIKARIDADPSTPGVQLPRWMHETARVLLGVSLIVAVLASLAGVATLVFQLSAQHLNFSFAASAFNAVVATVALPLFALAGMITNRHSTRAIAKFWFVTWAVILSGVLTVFGIMSSKMVASIDALVGIGQIAAPVMTILLAIGVGNVAMSLPGEDRFGSADTIRDLLAKLAVIGLSMFGLWSFAAARGVAGLYALALASVIEMSFVSLIWRREHTPLTRALLWAFGGALGINAVETSIANMNLPVPGRELLSQIGLLSIAISPLLCVCAAVAMAQAKIVTERVSGPSIIARVTSKYREFNELRRVAGRGTDRQRIATNTAINRPAPLASPVGVALNQGVDLSASVADKSFPSGDAGPLLTTDGRACAQCGTQFSGRANRKYCSDKCRKAAERAGG